VDVVHPDSAGTRAARDQLLTKALRGDGAVYEVAAEYPLVLAADGAELSYCVRDADGEIIAHANLWPRFVAPLAAPEERIAVGLVGNVATDERCRGRGIMRDLLAHLRGVAAQRGLRALLLWSDLQEFYQRQGFASCGAELRFVLPTGVLARTAVRGVELVSPSELSFADFAALLATRRAARVTLERSAYEFAKLAAIPGMRLAVSREGDSELTGYALMGKGADMHGVVHEWGARRPEELLTLAAAVAQAEPEGDAIILAPASLAPSWTAALRRYAVREEKHPMAHAWIAPQTTAAERAVLAQTFVWGLDSI
jgi:GNAT superfamily N-acetyltransferase